MSNRKQRSAEDADLARHRQIAELRRSSASSPHKNRRAEMRAGNVKGGRNQVKAMLRNNRSTAASGGLFVPGLLRQLTIA